MNRLKSLFTRALRKLKTKGVAALLRSAVAFAYGQFNLLSRYCFGYYVVYLYEHTMKARSEAEFLPAMQDYVLKIVSNNQQADELGQNGFQDFRQSWQTAKRGLETGGTAFCIFSGRELVHIGWVATTNEAKDTFDLLPYRVDFSSHEACTGGTWTSPKYRGQGLMKYIYFKRFQYLRENGIKISRNAVDVGNVASQKVHAKFGPRIYARARYLRLGKWYLKKETPISLVGQPWDKH
jgi:RimJ/RimL family protein N-acetyltransferase